MGEAYYRGKKIKIDRSIIQFFTSIFEHRDFVNFRSFHAQLFFVVVVKLPFRSFTNFLK